MKTSFLILMAILGIGIRVQGVFAVEKHPCFKAKNSLCQKIVILRPKIDLDEALNLSHIFHKKAKKYKVPADILLSIAYQESTLNLGTIRYISGLHLVNGKYEKVLIGSDFCMMQINSANILKKNLDTEKLLTDADYCIDNGAKILSEIKKIYERTDETWWTFYNAKTKEHRQKYEGHVGRHLAKLEVKKTKKEIKKNKESKENKAIEEKKIDDLQESQSVASTQLGLEEIHNLNFDLLAPLPMKKN